MTPIRRYLEDSVRSDLREKMVFVGGPRQVGKTTFALGFLRGGSETHPAYLNWDDPNRRPQLLQGQLPPHQPLVIFDEIHKFARWRGLLKGLYDTNKSSVRFLVTGSARLDYYRKGGDSLQGRYHYYRLHPLSLREINSTPSRSDLDALLSYGGFPEVFRKANETFARRWRREHLQRVVYGDLRDLERVREVSMIELLLETLPTRVGAPLSIKNLWELLQVSHTAVESWISILERLYVCFRIAPYGAPKIRAVKKEKKLYFWDWAHVPEEGFRFENLVASQLLKYCHFVEDTEGYNMELRFLRDTDKREIDFVVLRDQKPLFAVECKSGEKSVSPAIHYFRERTPIPRFYQVHLGQADYATAGDVVRVLPYTTFCRELDLP